MKTPKFMNTVMVFKRTYFETPVSDVDRVTCEKSYTFIQKQHVLKWSCFIFVHWLKYSVGIMLKFWQGCKSIKERVTKKKLLMKSWKLESIFIRNPTTINIIDAPAHPQCLLFPSHLQFFTHVITWCKIICGGVFRLQLLLLSRLHGSILD